MSGLDTPPTRPSAGYIWLRILAWVSPGVAAPALFLAWVFVSFNTPSFDILALIGFLGCLAALTIFAGIWDALLFLTRKVGREFVRPGAVARWTGAFVFLQLFLIPFLGFTIITACTAMIGY